MATNGPGSEYAAKRVIAQRRLTRAWCVGRAVPSSVVGAGPHDWRALLSNDWRRMRAKGHGFGMRPGFLGLAVAQPRNSHPE